MNYEHDNEFGQRSDGYRTNPSMREDMQYGRRGDMSRRTSPPGARRPVSRRDGGNPPMYGGETQGRTVRRTAPSGMEGTGRTAPVSGATGRVRISDEERGRRASREIAAGQEQGMGRAAAGGGPPGTRGTVSGTRGARTQRTAGSSSGRNHWNCHLLIRLTDWDAKLSQGKKRGEPLPHGWWPAWRGPAAGWPEASRREGQPAL